MNHSLVSKTTLIVGTLFAMPSLYGAEVVYEVQKGDSLSKIAMDFSKQYSELNWRGSLELIKELNAEKFENYDRIEVGQKVRLPDQDYVHTFLAGMQNSSHGVVKRKPFNPQKNLVTNLTSSSNRQVANDTVDFKPKSKVKPENYTIEDAKKLEIKNAKGMTVTQNKMKEVPETPEVVTKKVVAETKVAQASKPKKDFVVKTEPVVEKKPVTTVALKEEVKSGKTYLIKKGDTLSEIALRFFGSEKLYDFNKGPMKKILELNPSVGNPDLIFAGTKLVIPGRNVASESTTKVEVEKKVEKQPEDELYWSEKERTDSLNPDFSYINFEEMIDIDFKNDSAGLTFKIG